MISRTFVVEIDRRGSQEQERLKWRWPQSHGSSGNTNDGTLVQDLMHFLEAKVAEEMGGEPYSGGYTVEMHHGEGGGWIPLTPSTLPETIPKNCRLHVSVAAKGGSTPAPAADGKGGTPAAAASATTGASRPRGSGRGQGVASADEEGGAGGLHGEGDLGEGAKVLALPWRRFDLDLGDETGGLDVCGRRLVVVDVPNSDEGTGLFTWDGSVLLAKHIEHQAEATIRDIGQQHPRDREESPRHRAHADDPTPDGTIVDCASGESSIGKRAIRVLELGCGTGLAGIAAGFALGNHAATGVEVVVTDLPYALENARANVARNAEALGAAGGKVVVTELDWCRPLPPGFMAGGDFDIILAADVVWLDDLVEPLVRTLERLTAGWTSSDDNHLPPQQPSEERPGEAVGADANSAENTPVANCTTAADRKIMPTSAVRAPVSCSAEEDMVDKGGGSKTVGGASLASSNGSVRNAVVGEMEYHLGDGDQDDDSQNRRESGRNIGAENGAENDPENATDEDPRRRQGRGPRRRVLLAYQWRSARTGRALLRELDKAFDVRELPAEDCHPDYAPSRNLCLFEAVRRDEKHIVSRGRCRSTASETER